MTLLMVMNLPSLSSIPSPQSGPSQSPQSGLSGLFFARRSHLPCIDCATTCNLVNVHCSAHGLELLRPPASKKSARLAFSSHAGRGSENGNDEISDLPLATLPASPPHKAAVKPPRFSSLTHSPTYKKRLLPMHTPTNMDGSTALDRS